jgi:polyhydroxybutyrate depolymerase
VATLAARAGSFLGAILVVAPGLVACGGSRSPAGSPLEAPDLGTDAGRESLSSGEPLVISVGGQDRIILVHLPAGAEGPVPLVINLHGSRFTAGQQETFSGMDATADAYGFIVAYPQAAIPSGHGFEWHVPGQPLFGGRAAPPDAPDDVKFIAAAVAAITRRASVDPKRVFVTGFSGGARMASQVACDLSETFAAAAAVGGLRFPSPCGARRAVPIVAFHGTADPVNPFEGANAPTWTYGVREAAEQWAAHDKCAGPIAESTPGPSVHRTRYTACRDAAGVELYAIDEAGHEWPGGPPMPDSVTTPLGPQTNAVDANAVIWRFFADHPLP